MITGSDSSAATLVARPPVHVDETPRSFGDFRRHARRTQFVQEDTERRYRAWRADRNVPSIRVGMLLGISGGWVLAAATALYDPEFATSFWPVPAISSPGFLLAAAVTYAPRFRRWQQGFVLIALALWGLPLTWILHVVADAPELATTGLMIIMFFAFGVFRLSPLRCLSVGLGMALLHQYQLLSVDVPVNGGLTIHSALAWAMSVVSLVVGTVNDRVDRTQFEQEHVIARQHEVIHAERERSDALLRNVLPEAVANRLKDGNEVIADVHDGVTILFADIVGFTPLSLELPPEVVVSILDDVFTFLDELADKRGVEKIKTVGDAYMAVAGAPAPREDHAEAIAELALDILDGIEELSKELPSRIEMRVGIATGSAIAGVIGRRRLAYDLWSDTVNTAARMESHGVPGRIQITDEMAKRIRSRYRITERGVIDVKGKGPTRTWFLEGRR